MYSHDGLEKKVLEGIMAGERGGAREEGRERRDRDRRKQARERMRT